MNMSYLPHTQGFTYPIKRFACFCILTFRIHLIVAWICPLVGFCSFGCLRQAFKGLLSLNSCMPKNVYCFFV